MNTSKSATQENQARFSGNPYWSYVQQQPSVPQNQQTVDSPWNTLGYTGWSYLPQQNQSASQHTVNNPADVMYNQQQQHTSAHAASAFHHQQNQYLQQQQHYDPFIQQQQKHSGASDYVVAHQNSQYKFSTNVDHQVCPNNNVSNYQYDYQEQQNPVQQHLGAEPFHSTTGNQQQQFWQAPTEVFYNQQPEYDKQNYYRHEETPFSQSTVSKHNVDHSDLVDNVFAPTVREKTPPEPTVKQDNHSLAAHYFAKSNTHSNSPFDEPVVEAAAAEDNEWGNWGDEVDHEQEELASGASHANFRETSAEVVEQVVGHVVAPDLVPTSRRPSAPNVQPNVVSEDVARAATQPEQQRKMPDLWLGHERSTFRNDPDVVGICYDTAQSDILEDISLETSTTNDAADEQENFVQTVGKLSKKLMNTLTSGETDADTAGSSVQCLENVLNDEAAATLSFAGGVNRQQQHHKTFAPTSVQQRRHSNASSTSATTPKLGFSELLTYSYYEAEVKRSSVVDAVESNDRNEEATPWEIDQQLPEADMSQMVVNEETEAAESEIFANNRRLDLEVNGKNEFAEHENVACEKSSSKHEPHQEDLNDRVVEGGACSYDEPEDNSPPEENSNKNHLDNWNQWEEDDCENVENFEAADTGNRLSDWRPESERDSEMLPTDDDVSEPILHRHEEAEEDRCRTVRNEILEESSEIIIEQNPLLGFSVKINESVNVIPGTGVSRNEPSPTNGHESLASMVKAESNVHAPKVVEPVLKSTGEVVRPQLLVGECDRKDTESMWSAMSNFSDKSLIKDPPRIMQQHEPHQDRRETESTWSVMSNYSEKSSSRSDQPTVIPQEPHQDRRETESAWSIMSNADEKSVKADVDDLESEANSVIAAAEFGVVQKGGSNSPKRTVTPLENKVPKKEERKTTVAGATVGVKKLTATVPKLTSVVPRASVEMTGPMREPMPVHDTQLINQFLEDAHKMATKSSIKEPLSPEYRRNDSSLWSTTANYDTEMNSKSFASSTKSKIQPLLMAERERSDPAPQQQRRTKNASSISSQASSILSTSRNAPAARSFDIAEKKKSSKQQQMVEDDVYDEDVKGDTLSKKRRETLHKRYKEATKKSQEIFARLNVSLLNTSVDVESSKRAPLVILPTGHESGLLHTRQSSQASTPPVRAAKLGGGSDRHSAAADERYASSNRGDDRRHLDVGEGRGDDTRYYRPNERRRPYSRASERDDSRYYNRMDNARNRPRSTQGFDSDFDSEEYEDDEIREYYKKWRSLRGPTAYDRRRASEHNSFGLQHSKSFFSQAQIDPAWQKYLYEFYRIHGYYPTYEQLHRMWADQQAAAAAAALNVTSKSQQPKVAKTKKGTASSSDVEAKPGGIAALIPANLKRTEEYVAGQQKHVFSDEKESEPSVSRQQPVVDLQADSERSFDVPSSVSAIESYLQVPHKHSVSHAVCRFGVGGNLIIVSGGNRTSGQRQTVVEVRHVRSFIKNDVELEENVEKFDAFPGPLLPTSTDKSVLLQFCQRKLEKYRHDLNIVDRDSAVLVWNLLICLIRQNGVVVGADAARLLVDGVEFKDTNLSEVENFPSIRGGRRQTDEDEEDYNDDERVVRERSYVNTSTQTVDRVEQHFRELLLGGTKKEALEWAIKHKLWGHALFLAMKIDQRTHTNVMIRFANSLALNDPLQTLYQMMSGVMPYAATQLTDDKWGDWRPHLAIILSNLSVLNGVASDAQAFERELMSVLTLGNTLMDDGRIFAAQFCYLCCHILGGWDVFSSQQQRRQYITLIGAHNELNSDEIYSVDRIQMTEVYEYAVGLLYAQSKQTFSLPPIQIYKLHYALQLAEIGYAEDAYKYCHAIATAVQQNPNSYFYSMVAVVVDLATKLQRYDSSLDTIGYQQQNEAVITQWIFDLNAVAQKLKERVNSADEESHAFVPYSAVGASTEENRLGEDQKKHFYIGGPPQAEEQPIYQQQQQHQQPVSYSAEEEIRFGSESRRESAQTQGSFRPNENEFTQQQQASAVSTPRHSVGRGDRYSSNDDFADAMMDIRMSVTGASSPSSVVSPINREHRRSYAEATAASQVDFLTASSNLQRENDFYDRMSSTPTSKPVALLGALAAKQHFGSTSTDGAVSDNVFTPSPRQNISAKEVSSSSHQSNEGSKSEQQPPKRSQSWLGHKLGGVLRKVLPKDANEMILPDDKTKSIVWDDKTGRWVNTDGEAADDVPPPPPPSLASSNAYMSNNSNDASAVGIGQLGQNNFANGVMTSTAPAPVATVKPVSRFASQGKRYATIDAFGGGTPAAAPAMMPSAMPPLPSTAPQMSGPAKKMYFVPSATNDADVISDPFSVAEPTVPNHK